MATAHDRTMRYFAEVRPLITFLSSDTVRSAIDLLPRKDTGAACVLDENGNLAGILTIRNLLWRVLAVGKNPDSVLVGEIMIRDPVTVEADSCIQKTLDMMTDKGYRYIPIMDNKKVIGLADIRDLYEVSRDLLHKRIADKSSLFAKMMSEPYGYDPYEPASGRA